MLVSDLKQIQVGLETVWGTAVNPTSRLAGITDVSINPGVNITDFQSLEGLAPSYDSAVTGVAPTGSLSGLLLYQDLLYWLESIFGAATPSGAGPYTREYEAPLASAVVSPRMMTLYEGDDSAGYSLLGAMANTLEISCSSNEAGQLSVGLIGKSVAGDAPAVLSKRTVDVATGDHFDIYIDAWDGTIGTTVIPCTAYSFSLSLTANRNLRNALGSLTPCTSFHTRFGGTLNLTLEFPGDGNVTKTILDSLITPTLIERQIRIKGTKSAARDMQFDFAGYVSDSPDIWSDSDGVSTIELSFMGKYNPTLGNWFIANIINDLATIP